MKFSLWLGITFFTASSLLTQADQISAFSPNGGVDGVLYAVAVQPDGAIIIGGQFSSVNGVPRQNLARLNADGTVDKTFLAKDTAGVNGAVYALALQNDGSVIAGGLFSVASQKERSNLVRYAADGSIDPNFAALGGANGKVLALSVAPDGSVVLGGEFSEVASQPRRNVAVLATDGTLKAALVPSVNGSINKLVLAATEGVVAVGDFSASDSHGSNIVLFGN